MSLLAEGLAAILRRGVDTIRVARDCPQMWCEPSDEAIRPFDKMLAEACLLALLARRALGEHPAVTGLVGAILDCEETLNRSYEIVRWRPYLWTSAGAIWVYLDQLGEGDERKRARLRELWGTPVVEPCERVPYRLLDQAWTRSMACRGEDSRLTSAGLRSVTSLENLDGGLHMRVADLYAVTHAAMYLTDFGRKGRIAITPGWIGPMTAARLLVGDFDLAAELAITNMLTTEGPVPGTRLAANALSTVFHHLGFIPAPTYREADHHADAFPESYLHLHSYHSTLVYGLLCAVLIGDDDGVLAPHPHPAFPREWHGRRAVAGPLSSQVAHTYEAWLPLTGDPEGLLRTVVDAYLFEAHRDGRLKDVLELLGMGAVAGPSPVDRAARNLLATRARLGGEPCLAQRLITA